MTAERHARGDDELSKAVARLVTAGSAAESVDAPATADLLSAAGRLLAATDEANRAIERDERLSDAARDERRRQIGERFSPLVHLMADVVARQVADDAEDDQRARQVLSAARRRVRDA